MLHEIIVRLQREPAKAVLDVPSGRGVLVPTLRALGCEISAADIRPDLFEPRDVACRYANLNQGLPYPSESFDAVLCCNGIHRVYALGFAVSEMARVLRPEGRLLLSFPNFSSLSRRVRFLLTGSFSPSFVRSAEVDDASGGMVRLPVTPAQVLAAVEASGLRVEEIRGLRRRPEKIRLLRVLYLPLVAPIWLASLLSRRRKRRGLRLSVVSRFDLLFNDFVLIAARKAASPNGAGEERRPF
ncbi:MAG TPA: class I SAM-dependent methyltransferase [Myxococcota bacterium]|nr:class I SAM-dependent methyltransferase [Myxococcota bacterium]